MAPRSPRDVIEYFDDNSEHEDETAFFPVRPDGPPDSWSFFWGGILIGLAGAGLVTLAHWLAGLLIFAGYGMTAASLRGSRTRFARALGFGYALLACVGAAMLLGTMFFPNVTASVIAAAAAHHVIFLSLATLAWPIALLKYVFELATRRNHPRRRLAEGSCERCGR
ncbi:MAG: hypothetical protein WCF79_07860 [Rhodomicrobium sp.]